MQLWRSTKDLKATLDGAADVVNGKLEMQDERKFRDAVETVIWNAVFNKDESLKETARAIIWEASIALGCPSASIHELYMARAADVYDNMTVPAINIRGLTFDVARTIFKTLMKQKTKACLFEIARSEISYTFQTPAEYAALVLAAAIAEGYKGPVFLQGDHFQVNAKKWKADAGAEIGAVKKLIKEAIDAGFYNIDIDTSTLVDLERPSVKEEQRNNFEVTAELLRTVRENEPRGVTVSVGGEIGEVGGKNSTAEEFVAYLEGINELVEGWKRNGTSPFALSLSKGTFIGPSKISIQTGTTHGGVPMPDGTVAQVKLDFNCLKELGEIGRKKFHIGGVVQHGASTLPQEAFDNFPKTKTLEVHLATGFQNMIYDSPNFPAELKKDIYKWLNENCAADKKAGETDEQFYYKTRKKGFGPFKERLWSMPADTRIAIMSELARTFDMLFTKLGITGCAELVEKYIKPNPPHRKI